MWLANLHSTCYSLFYSPPSFSTPNALILVHILALGVHSYLSFRFLLRITNCINLVNLLYVSLGPKGFWPNFWSHIVEICWTWPRSPTNVPSTVSYTVYWYTISICLCINLIWQQLKAGVSMSGLPLTLGIRVQIYQRSYIWHKCCYNLCEPN